MNKESYSQNLTPIGGLITLAGNHCQTDASIARVISTDLLATTGTPLNEDQFDLSTTNRPASIAANMGALSDDIHCDELLAANNKKKRETLNLITLDSIFTQEYPPLKTQALTGLCSKE